MWQFGLKPCSLHFYYAISLHIVPIREHTDMKELP